MDTTEREFAKSQGMHWLVGGDEAAWNYQQAVERFEREGDAVAYMRSLLALGVPAADIRYLVANPGRGICLMY